MSKRKFIYFAFVACLFVSCKTNFYQIYKVDSVTKVSKSSNSLIYEDDCCKVLYDFWGEGGNVGFMIYNKTDKNIYVNKKESFFICNGIAYDYFRNRTFTDSKSSSFTTMVSNSTSVWDAIGASASKSLSGYNYLGFKQTNSISAGIATGIGIAATKTKGVSTLSGSSVAFKEEEIMCIPPNSAKVITEYNITESLYRDCNLYKYPSKKKIITSRFSASESPFVFSNRIAYSVGDSETLKSFENKFYVSEITNYPEKEVLGNKREKFCGEEDGDKEYPYFINVAPDKFYIQYSKTANTLKH